MLHEQPQADDASAGTPTTASDIADQADQLCYQGLYGQAQSLLPQMDADPRVAVRLTAARIRWHLGARREADGAILKLWRQHRTDDRALLEMTRAVFGRHGPYRAWKLFGEHHLGPQAPADVQAEWHSLHAYVLGTLRDFEAAEQAHQRALTAQPAEPWVLVEWAHVSEMRDRYAEAVDLAERALALRPGYRAAIRSLAHFYTLAGRHSDARQLLERAVPSTQCGALAVALFDLQFEQGHMAAAWDSLDHFERCVPLADPELLEWLAARRTDVAMRSGELDRARQYARLVTGPFYERMAERLADPQAQPGGRVLDVRFVRQHHNTCAPATLAALSSYWGHTASHLEIAEAICYDGTPHHSERRWAEEQGFDVHEFTVDWDTTRALIDAGLPFTLSTVATGSGHLQAVVGYDALRRTLLIRDPFKPTHNEFDATAFFESHRSSGPRGMLLLPPEERPRLHGITLPDIAAWDGYHAVLHALQRHDRDAAAVARDALQQTHPDHLNALAATRALAAYDGNDAAMLPVVEQIIERYPQDTNFLLTKASLLSSISSREQCEEWWQNVQERAPGDPIVTVRHAQFLSGDGRQHRKVFGLLEKALAVAPTDATAWFVLAGLHWQRGLLELGLQHYRVAACLQLTNEYHADTYARAARAAGQGLAGFVFLERRVEQLARLSSAPVQTLYSQLESVDRTTEGLALLELALRQRPQDADLQLYAAEVHIRHGELDKAAGLIEQARPHAKQSAWLRQRAILCRETGHVAEALRLTRQASEIEPLNLAHHRQLASLLAQTSGRDAAVQALREVAQHHPHHCELQRLLLAWLPDDALEDAIELLQRLLTLDPHDAWAWRELAFKLGAARRFDAAREAAQTGLANAPRSSFGHSTMGFVSLRQGRTAEARRHMREALVLSADNEYALNALVEMETTLEGRLEALGFIRGELVRQVTMGDGLLAFQETARWIMPPDDLLVMLQDALKQREDLWQTWVTTASQLARMDRIDEALELLGRGVERFPLLPRLHYEQAQTLILASRREAARHSLQRALQISGAWPAAVRLHTDSILDEGQAPERALPVLESALLRLPDHADLRALHGWVRWRMGQADTAIRELQAAVTLDPGLRWAWDALQRVSREHGQPVIAAETAEAAVQRRPGDAQAWLRLAEFAGQPDRALEAADTGLRLEPRHRALFEARLGLLLRARRLLEIEQVLAASPWGEETPALVAVYGARVQRARGQLEAARTALRTLLARDASQFGLWRELADWCDEEDRHDDYLEAARKMAELAPQAGVSHAYVGHALSKQGHTAEAIGPLQRAMELDPSYTFAGLLLFDQQLQLQQHHVLEATLNSLEQHERSHRTALRRLRLHTVHRQRDEAVTLAAKMVCESDIPEHFAELVVREIRQADWNVYFAEALEPGLASGPCALPAVMLWMEHEGGGWLPGAFYRDIRKAISRGDPVHAIKRAFLIWMAERQPDRRLLDRFVHEHRLVLHQDTGCWAHAGYAYVHQGRHGDAVQWMSDWPNRPDVPSWALDNLALSLRQIGRPREARQASDHSLSLEPRGGAARTWLAVDCAQVDDDLNALEEHLRAADESSQAPYYRRLLVALHAYLKAARANRSKLALADFAALRPHLRGDHILRRLVGQLRRKLIQRHTPWWQRAWRNVQFTLGLR